MRFLALLLLFTQLLAAPPARVGRVQIGKDTPINQSTYLRMSMSLEEFKKRGVDMVLLELDTPGGEVYSTMKIARLLREFDKETKIPVFCYIDDWAISAGAMVAYACRIIGVNSRSIMGAAEPVIGGEPASEKINSALRAEFASVAGYYGRDPLIAKAMVDKDLILVWRGKVIELKSEDQIASGDRIITTKGKLLTLNANELMEFDVANVFLKESPYPNAQIIEYSNWKLNFFDFLGLPIISSLLFMGLMIGFYMEMSTPGFGAPGIVALVCLCFILLSSFAIYTVSYLEVLVLGAGVVLILLELFATPGLGVLGVIGGLLFLIGLITMVVPVFDVVRYSQPTFVWPIILSRLAWIGGAIILSVIIIAILTKVLRGRVFVRSRIVLTGEENREEGFTSGHKLETQPSVGERGVAKTPLRPSGKIEVCGMMHDAITEGDFVEAGSQIEVMQINESKIVVKQI